MSPVFRVDRRKLQFKLVISKANGRQDTPPIILRNNYRLTGRVISRRKKQSCSEKGERSLVDYSVPLLASVVRTITIATLDDLSSCSVIASWPVRSFFRLSPVAIPVKRKRLSSKRIAAPAFSSVISRASQLFSSSPSPFSLSLFFINHLDLCLLSLLLDGHNVCSASWPSH